MTKPAPSRYRTKNWKPYNEALKRRGSLLVWLDRDMVWLAPRGGRPGRPPVFSDAAVQFCNIADLTPNDGSGGVICVDRDGNISMPFNCEGMYRGMARAGEGLETFIYR